MSDIWYEGLTLRSWHLGNFKSVRTATVHLAPLTVVVGGNSAGKSTLLQSIRVASQAATSDSSVFPLNGEQFRPGTFAETRFAGASAEDAIEIGGDFNVGQFRTRFYDGPHPARTYRRPRPRRRRDEDVQLSWQLRLHGTPEDQSAATNVQAIEVTASQGGEPAARLSASSKPGGRGQGFGRDRRYVGGLRNNDWPEHVVDVRLSGGFPEQLLREVDLADDLFWSWQETQSLSVRSNINRLSASESRPEPREVDNDRELVARIVADIRQAVEDVDAARHTSARLLSARLRDSLTQDPVSVNWTPEKTVRVFEAVSKQLGWKSRRATRPMPLPDVMEEALDEVRFFLANRVQHLGPLRMDPQVVYRSSPASQPGFIGAKGEYSASVLQTSGRQPAPFAPMPPNFSRNIPDHLVTLGQAVNAWAAHLGIGDSFQTTDQGRLGLQLLVTQPDVDIELDLTSVGTGVSQLLPVLVMCLHAPPGSLLLIEQPELHLNPAVQQGLADFLLAVARSGRQLIVETHSDYLVSRLRRRAAEDSSEATRESIRIVFAERHDGVTKYHEATPEPDGSMTSWPAGFFEEAAEDSYALLSAMLDRAEDAGDADTDN